ncbi:MAG: PQQ-binding-like beta-propeller repeat protein [Clostridia bacterium]|nr:PQQ-binding-like beta-propeller repeat protein [Clostridia bacterium]
MKGVFYLITLGFLIGLSIFILYSNTETNNQTILTGSNDEWNIYMKTYTHSFPPPKIKPPFTYVTNIKTGTFTFLTEWFPSLYTLNNMLIDKKLLIVSQSNTIMAYKRNNLNLSWSYPLPGDYQINNQGALVQNENLLYFGAWSSNSKEGLISAIDKSTNRVIWERKIKGLYPRTLGANPPGFGMNITGNKLIVSVNGNSNNSDIKKTGSNLLVLDLHNGTLIWEKTFNGFFLEEAIPTVFNNDIYISETVKLKSGYVSYVYRIDLSNGKTLFRQQIKDIVISRILVSNEEIFIANYNDNQLKSAIYSLKIDDGKVYWTKDIELVNDISISSNQIYVSYYGGIMAIDITSGKTNWVKKLGDDNYNDFSSPVIPIENYIVGGGNDSNIRIIHMKDGTEQQIINLSRNIKGVSGKQINLLIVSGDYIFGAITDGRIVIFKGTSSMN